MQDKRFLLIKFKFHRPCVWLPDCSKLAINRKNDNDVTVSQQDAVANFFDVNVFFLSSLVIGPSFMSISLLVLEIWQFSFYKGLARNLEVGNIPVWAFPKIWRLGWIRDTKFRTNVNECCKMPVTSFTISELLKENQQGEGVGKITSHSIVRRGYLSPLFKQSSPFFDSPPPLKKYWIPHFPILF